MKLYFGPNSPYVHKVMICAHEKGLIDRVELVDVRDTPDARRGPWASDAPQFLPDDRWLPRRHAPRNPH